MADAQNAEPRIVAGVDCGTNSIRLLVAEVLTSNDGPSLRDLTREMRIIRLGQGVDATGRINPDAIGRCREALADYAVIAHGHGATAIRMVATSATRDAENKDDFFDMTAEVLGAHFLGARAEVISGETEAELTFAGGVGDLDPADGPFLVTDLGGGSTELVLGGLDAGAPRIDAAFSMNIGCVRLTERVLHSQPPEATEVRDAKAIIAAAIDEARGTVDVGRARTWVGVAGTFTTLMALALGLDEYDSERIHLARIPLGELHAVCQRLLGMTAEERRALGPMHPGRADVIGGGALVAAALADVAEDAGIAELVVSEKDILDGIALSIAG
ncbi:Ppx/GppA phosphatase family protein [Dietzia sp.]|uniref:Ppx/GppA phosphatase family protein n=1 Tax=Dietzia sp. TaxID=1871616 RepID=UPI002FD8C91A